MSKNLDAGQFLRSLSQAFQSSSEGGIQAIRQRSASSGLLARGTLLPTLFLRTGAVLAEEELAQLGGQVRLSASDAFLPAVSALGQGSQGPPNEGAGDH